MILFEHPAALALCLAPLAALAAGAIRGRSHGRRRARSVRLPLDLWGGSPSPDAPPGWKLAGWASTALLGLAWVSMSIAAAGPASLAPAAAVDKLGMHVVFAIDVSPSMAARDLEPSRLEAAKSFVGAFLSSPDGAAGASVGLVAFGAEAALACPPTTDYATVLERLESLQPGVLGDGTALGQGLASAYRQIVASGSRRAVAVLLSDGEDNVGLVHPEDAAKALRGGGVRFLVVGVGSKGDVPIDYVNPVTGQRMSGEYRSGFDSDAMAAIAAAGGGDYRAAPDARSLSGLVKELGESSLAATEPYLLDDPLGVGGGRVAGRGAASSAPRRPYGRILALISMGLAAAAWAVWRLVFGGLL